MGRAVEISFCGLYSALFDGPGAPGKKQVVNEEEMRKSAGKGFY